MNWSRFYSLHHVFIVDVVGHDHETAEEAAKQYGGERGVDLGGGILCETQSDDIKHSVQVIMKLSMSFSIYGRCGRDCEQKSLSPLIKRSICVRVMS